MNKTPRKLYLGIGLTLSLLIGAGAAQADERSIWMRFAGALMQNVEQTEVSLDGTTTVPARIGAVYARTWGNLGYGDIKGQAVEVVTGPPAPDPACPEMYFKVADIIENNLVLTFADLSLLYGEGSGAICVNFVTDDVVTPISGMWTGGTQRFRGATGDWYIEFDEAVPD